MNFKKASIDEANISRMLASDLLQDEVVEERSFLIGNAYAWIWKNTDMLPVTKVCVCVSGKEAVASVDLESFGKILRLAALNLEYLVSHLDLLKSVLPSNYSMLPTGRDFIDEQTGNQPTPSIKDNNLIFYCNDYTNGVVLEVSISADYRLVIKNVRAGLEFWAL